MNLILRFLYLILMDCNGRNVSVSLVQFIRPELKFSTEDLISQMEIDCKIIEELLK